MTCDQKREPQTGENHPRAVYTDHEVDMVRRLRDGGMSYGEISRRMEIPKSTVRDYCKCLIR